MRSRNQPVARVQRPKAITAAEFEQRQREIQALAKRRAEQAGQQHINVASDTFSETLRDRTGVDPRSLRPGSVFARLNAQQNSMVVRGLIEIEVPLDELSTYVDGRLTTFLDAPLPPEESDPPVPEPVLCLAPSPYGMARVNCELLKGHQLPHAFKERTWFSTNKR